MRLLHVVNAMDPEKGGVSQAVQTIAAESIKLGVYNEVVCLDIGQIFCSRLFTIHALGPSKGPWGYNNKLIPWLLENLFRFDTIIVHGLWLYQSYAVSKALRKFKQVQYKSNQYSIPKLFIMPHGMLDPYFQRSRKRKLKAIRNWVYWKLIEGRVINKADGILFTCKEECRLAEKPFRPYKPKQKLIVGLGNAEPPDFVEEMRTSFFEKCPDVKNSAYILFLSRIDPKKGVDLLINAYERIISEDSNKEHSEVQTKMFPKLVIAGPGLETPYGHKIQAMVNSSLILRSSIFFPGMLTGDAKWGAFYGCESFILPSHQENFGIAVVEALACAKPVLISKQVNISAEIKDNKGGFIEEDTLEGTYNMLSLWRAMPDDEKLIMGYQARKCFESDFKAGPATNRIIKAINKTTDPAKIVSQYA